MSFRQSLMQGCAAVTISFRRAVFLSDFRPQMEAYLFSHRWQDCMRSNQMFSNIYNLKAAI